ncbi:MAG: CocE/NonD family hydrolase C-terminal non-catalytic domain-containing protein [Actinomycetota bacterium]
MFTPAAYEYAVAAPPPSNYSAPNYVSNLLDTTCSTDNVIRGMALDGTMTEYWKERDYPSMAGNIKAAVFHAHGTLDENVKMDHFGAMWDALEAHNVRRKALIGPWEHAEPDVPFWHLIAMRWFEHWLNDNDTGMMREPPITVIDQEDQTRSAETWPPARRKLVLEAGSEALARAVEDGSATYQDVPQLPRQLLRAATGARLLYTSEPVKEPLRVSGAPVFEVVAAINSSDANFVVHLYDVDEAGSAVYVTRGYLDAQHRAGLAEAENVAPGKDFRYRVPLHDRDYVFAAGHSIQILVASSDSCVWLIGGPLSNCRSSGVVSDITAPAVTVKEGPGLTRLILPLADL